MKTFLKAVCPVWDHLPKQSKAKADLPSRKGQGMEGKLVALELGSCRKTPDSAERYNEGQVDLGRRGDDVLRS